MNNATAIILSIIIPIVVIAIIGFLVWYCLCFHENVLSRMRKQQFNRTNSNASIQANDQYHYPCEQVATSSTAEQFSKSTNQSVNNVLYSKYFQPYENVIIGPLSHMEGDDLKESFSPLDHQQFDNVQRENYDEHIYGNDNSVDDSLYLNYNGPHNEYIEEDGIYIIAKE